MAKKLIELAQEGLIKLNPLSAEQQSGFQKAFEAGKKRMEYYAGLRQQDPEYLKQINQHF